MHKCFLFITLILLSSCQVTRNNGKHAANANSSATEKKRNVIFLIGDGMGITQISAGMFMNNNYLELERCPIVGLHKPYSADDLITDSAAGATAFSIGRKTKNGYLGVDSSKQRFVTILEEAESLGFATGMVATSSLVHATPAAFISHQSRRDDHEAIAKDFLLTDIDIFIGGGQKYFNRRIQDSLDLVVQLRNKNYFVTDYFEQDFDTWVMPSASKIVFFTADGEPLPVSKGRTYLPKATELSLNFLHTKSDKGFFIMIEGSQIDWGGHANDADYIVTELLDFNKAIKVALDFAEKDKNTLVVITADHETGGFAINPGSKFGKLETSFSSKKHSGDLIPVFAFGPGAENFSGIYENTEIYYKLKKVLFDKKK